MDYRPLLLMALLAAPAAVQAQGAPPPQGERRDALLAGLAALEQGSVQYLVTKRAELALSAEQTSQLRAVASRWLETTRASREALRTAIARDSAQAVRTTDLDALRGRMQQLLPHALLLLQEDRMAVEEALQRLRPEQQRQAKALLDARLAAAGPPRR